MKKSLIKAERLKKRKDIERIFQQGKRKETDKIRLLYVPNNLQISRIMITFVKKIGCAPFRNRQRRLVREAFRLNKDIIKAGFDLAFMVKKELSSFQEAQKEILFLIDTAELKF